MEIALLSLVLLLALFVILSACRPIKIDYTTAVPTGSLPASSQFDRDEALAMLELCVDLDSQDDRTSKTPRNIYNLRMDRLADWDYLVDSRVLVANHKGLMGADRLNPAMNGYDPFDSAWTLWKRKTAGKNGASVYAVAFRGTVFAAKPSVVEDTLATTIAARRGLKIARGSFLPITFASLPRAEVHEGFAYAAFGQLFDREFGLLPHIEKLIGPGSTLIITGHSQGAGLATLTHAFFHYAALEKRFGLGEKNLALRSYAFAQPKPGNMQFAMDFAGITGAGATSFVLNNSLDPVPMFPTTHSFSVGALQDTPQGGDSTLNRFVVGLRGVNDGLNRVSAFFSRWLQDKSAKRIAQIQRQDHDGYWHSSELRAASDRHFTRAYSQYYTTAGNVVPLQGIYMAKDYYGDPRDATDEFVQHHASTYRRLLEILFGLAPTTESSSELAPPPSDQSARNTL